MAALAPELAWEPALALTPGGDGLDAYRRIAAGAADRLGPSGRIALEIGPDQADPVTAVLAQAGFDDAVVTKDLDGRDRVVSVRRDPKLHDKLLSERSTTATVARRSGHWPNPADLARMHDRLGLLCVGQRA
jgi:hypothetical protein